MHKETIVESGKPERRLESKSPPLSQQHGNPSSYVGTPAVGTSRAVSSAGISSTGPPNTLVNKHRRRFTWSCVVAFLSAWLIAFFRFFLTRVLFEPATFSRLGIRPSTLWESTRNGCRSIGSGLTVRRTGCSSFMRAVPIWVALLIGNQRRTSSSARVTAAVTTVKALILRVRHHDRWIAPVWTLAPTARSSSMWVGSTPGRRANEISSMIRELTCPYKRPSEQRKRELRAGGSRIGQP
jgi:hypothetical protein